MKNIFSEIIRSHFTEKTESYIAQVRCKNKKTLDIGCGFGKLLQYDKKNFYGIEVNQDAIDYCKTKNYNVQKASVKNIPFENHTFECVTAIQVIEHLDIETAYTLLTESERILQLNGELILSTEMTTKKIWDTFSHVRPYPLKSILKLLKNDQEGLETFSKLHTLKPIAIYYTGIFFKNPLLNFLSHMSANYLRIGRRNYTLILKKCSH